MSDFAGVGSVVGAAGSVVAVAVADVGGMAALRIAVVTPGCERVAICPTSPRFPFAGDG